MIYLSFKDESIYTKSKYTIMITAHQTKVEPIVVEIQYIHSDSYWICSLPLESDLKKMEQNGEDISFWSKYRKWQKRKEYTLKEFNEIFTALSVC